MCQCSLKLLRRKLGIQEILVGKAKISKVKFRVVKEESICRDHVQLYDKNISKKNLHWKNNLDKKKLSTNSPRSSKRASKSSSRSSMAVANPKTSSITSTVFIFLVLVCFLNTKVQLPNKVHLYIPCKLAIQLLQNKLKEFRAVFWNTPFLFRMQIVHFTPLVFPLRIVSFIKMFTHERINSLSGITRSERGTTN